MMFAQVSRTCSNPATVAAMIRVNGLDAVRRGGMVAPQVIRAVCHAARIGQFDDYRKMLAERRISPRFIAMMKFARRYGPESLDAAGRRMHAARLVSALQDMWQERIGAGEAGRRHGWDVGHELQHLDRRGIYARALRLGLDLDAVKTACEHDVLVAEGKMPATRAVWRMKASARVMRRTCALFGVTPEELRSEPRPQRLSVPRFFYCYWAFRLAWMSYPEIGRKLGGRDHTTALHAVRNWPGKREHARGLIAVARKAEAARAAIRGRAPSSVSWADTFSQPTASGWGRRERGA